MLKFSKSKKSDPRLPDVLPGSDNKALGKRDKSPRINFFPFRSHHPQPVPVPAPTRPPAATTANDDNDDRPARSSQTVRESSHKPASSPATYLTVPDSARRSIDHDRTTAPYDTAAPKLSLDEGTLYQHTQGLAGDAEPAAPSSTTMPMLSASPIQHHLAVSPSFTPYQIRTSPKSGPSDHRGKRKDKGPPPPKAPSAHVPKDAAKSSKSRALGMFSGWSGKKHPDIPPASLPLEPTSSSESLKGVPLKKSTHSRHRNVPVFGTEIAVAAEATQLDDGLPLPAVVIRCIEYLDDQGLYEIGLYRIPGSSSRVGKLRAIFDKGRDIDLEQCETDPHSVAGLLKLYLRELPSAPLTDELLPEFNAVVNPPVNAQTDQHDRDYQIALVLAQIAKRLPDPNYYLFHWLCRHLARLDYYSDINKMNLSNLGLIFCPTLRIKSYVFRAFVTQSDVVFPLPRRTSVAVYDSYQQTHYSVAGAAAAVPTINHPADALPSANAAEGVNDPYSRLSGGGGGGDSVQLVTCSAENLSLATDPPPVLRGMNRRSHRAPLSVCEPPTFNTPRHSIKAAPPRSRTSGGGPPSSYDDMDMERMSKVYDTDEILRYFNALRSSIHEGGSDPGPPAVVDPVSPTPDELDSIPHMPPHLAHLEHLHQFTSDGGSAIARSKMTRSQRRRGVFILQQGQDATFSDDTSQGLSDGPEFSPLSDAFADSSPEPRAAGLASGTDLPEHTAPQTEPEPEPEPIPVASPLVNPFTDDLILSGDDCTTSSGSNPDTTVSAEPNCLEATPPPPPAPDLPDPTPDKSSSKYKFFKSLSPFGGANRSPPDVPTRKESLEHGTPNPPRRSSKRRPALPVQTDHPTDSIASTPLTAPLLPTQWTQPGSPTTPSTPTDTSRLIFSGVGSGTTPSVKRNYNPFHSLTGGSQRSRSSLKSSPTAAQVALLSSSPTPPSPAICRPLSASSMPRTSPTL
ncbi:hypothetical protein H4R33_001250 [Dimargaris cristalligena]|nr:hypothetical protein H4R33_001250 [Dimargaris cristalligena]